MKLRQIIENEYAGLEDADEFVDPIIQFPDGSAVETEIVASLYNRVDAEDLAIPELYLDAYEQSPMVDYRNYGHGLASFLLSTDLVPNLTESSEYAGLEDADEFEKGDFDNCQTCGDAVGYENLLVCPLCGRELCESCSKGHQERHIKAAEQRPNHTNWKMLESYAGLEDDDEFGEDLYYRCELCGFRDPAEITQSGEYVDDNAPVVLKTCRKCEADFCNDCGYFENSICAECARRSIAESLLEMAGEYAGLEDDDEFRQKPNIQVELDQGGPCTYCGQEIFKSCKRCNSGYCWDCLPSGSNWSSYMEPEDRARFQFEPEWSNNTGLPRGVYPQLTRCPQCTHRLSESVGEYAGLEDADEFGDPLEALHAASYNFLPQRIKYWGKADDFISTFIEHGDPDAFDPREVADRVIEAYLEYGYELADTVSGYPEDKITESAYAGLEDADEFDDGSDREETEEVLAYFKANNIVVVENDGVIDITDKHGVLEGLPDGRRFGDDLPVDRVITPARDPNFTNDLFVVWINEAYGVAWLVNYGNDWNIIDWQQWQRFKDIQINE